MSLNRFQGALRVSLLLLACGLPRMVQADDIRQITLTANDLAYDPGTQRIYASVPSSAGSGGNSIVAIDPVAATTAAPVFVGSEPNRLALSSDGQFLYVGLDGASSVRRFDMATQTASLQFPIGTPYQVEDMAVLPGQPHAVAVVQQDPRYSPHFAGTVIYDDGVARANSRNGQDSIAFSASASRLYGYNNSISSFDFDRLTIDATGFTDEDQNGSLISGYGLNIAFADDHVFVNNGEVIDPEAQTILGTFSNAGYGVPFAVQPGDQRAFFLTGSGSSLVLRAYDTTTFLQTGMLTITGVSGSPHRLIRWGSSGLAFSTTGNQLFLIRTALVPPLWTAVSTLSLPNGTGRLLWTTRTGRAALWTLSADGQVVSRAEYGPFAGWTPQKLAAAPDGTTRLLWSNADGRASFWKVNTQTAVTYSPTYGPFAGWTAKDIAVASDGTVRLLWSNVNGAASYWTVSSAGVPTYGPVYGPYSGWSANAMAAGANGALRLLWDNSSGAASFWTIAADGTPTYSPVFGPYSGWTGRGLTVDGSGLTHLLWTHTDGRVGVWSVAASGAVDYGPVYGPYPGWEAKSLSGGSSGTIRLLWVNTDGTASFWDVDAQHAPVYSPVIAPPTD